MRKIYFLSIFFIYSLNSFAQDDAYKRKNDILLDPISLIAGPVVNASYERIFSSDFGAGISFIGGDGIDMVQFSPFGRMYFGQKYANGFFLEGFIPITKTEDYNYESSVEKTVTTVGAGVGLGGKWVLKRNILLEVGGGIARRFRASEAEEDITGKWMIGVGYRF